MTISSLLRSAPPGFVAFMLAGGALAQGEPGTASVALSEAVCTGGSLAAAIEPDRIGEPVAAVSVDTSVWVADQQDAPVHCSVTGRLEPVDRSATARPIRFGVALPAEWNRRSVQMGGGGMNGTIPALAGGGFGGRSELARGFATYGSDSGHASGDEAWALNDEAIRNLGYLQMKKTRDVAMILIERAYGRPPAYNYYVGGSQGGREGLTVAQRYPEDYDGVLSTVPIVGFSSLMLAPALTRIQERELEHWVPPAKGAAILAEFMRRCDDLDGRVDGVIHNYFDCRAIFNVHDGIGETDSWSALRCPDDVDPAPDDASVDACLTSGQIETVEFVFSSYAPAAELANGRSSFGMWAPSTAVAGSGSGPPGGGPGGMAPPGALFVGRRYRGQAGASADAPVFATLGSLGVNGFIMQDVDANPLDYDADSVRDRREQVSRWLDSTDPDLSRFGELGGKLIVAVGTDDTIAPSGEQLDYYQSVIDLMGRDAVDSFARFFVLPQTGHGLTGRTAPIDGNGEPVEPRQIPSGFDRFSLLRTWVENGVAPGFSETVSGAGSSRPLCSYPRYPRYTGGEPAVAASYECAAPAMAPPDP